MTGTVSSRAGLAVASHPLAAQAAIAVLGHGGSVADAAIAGTATLCVVLPQKCALGGDGFALVHADGRSLALNASGPAPAAATLERIGPEIPDRGAIAATVPAIVAGWGVLHERFGRARWASLFDHAIRHARDGFPVSRELAADVTLHRAVLARDPGCEQLFGAAREGVPLVQSALAATLVGIAEHGAGWFHRGPAAASIAEFVRAHGGLLQAADFGAVAPFFTEPLAIGYREVAVATPPPNSYGAMLLAQLALLGREPAAPDVIERLVQWITANRRALEALAGRIADPSCVARPDIAALVCDPARSPLGHGDTRGGTATVSVADGAGNGATIILSVFRGFGAGVLDPATGVLLNNRMRGFSLDARHPNVVAPGKRPAHTLSPALVTRDGVLRYLVASPGGVGQTVTLTQVIANLVDRGMSVDDAVAAPRWSREADGDPIVEAGFGAGVVEALAARGITAKIGAARAVYFGSAELIARAADGMLSSAPDPRRDGAAVGL